MDVQPQSGSIETSESWYFPNFSVGQTRSNETFGLIAQALKDGSIWIKLISFHATSPKFTEFKE